MRVRARARARARAAYAYNGDAARRRGGGAAEDGSELRSHACGVAKVEARGHAPGVGRIGGTRTNDETKTNKKWVVTHRHFQRTTQDTHADL